MADPEQDDELTEEKTIAKLTEAAEAALANIQTNALSILADFHAMRARQQFVIDARWSEPFAHYDFCYQLAYSIGHGINERNRAAAAVRNDRVFEVLARLHSWALLTASEVRALVLTGHGGGALALSRTALEQAVIANFICEQGDDVAERYIHHSAYEQRKWAIEYDETATALGEDGFDPAELKALNERCSELATKYHPNYLTDYGWAAKALHPASPNPKSNFREIMKATDIGRIRHFYLVASHRVHASASGSGAHLYPSATGGAYVTGPSDIHLALPATATLFALQQTSAAFATHALQEYDDRQPTVEFMVLRRLTNEAADVFNGVEEALTAMRDAANPAESDERSEPEETEGQAKVTQEGDGTEGPGEVR